MKNEALVAPTHLTGNEWESASWPGDFWMGEPASHFCWNDENVARPPVCPGVMLLSAWTTDLLPSIHPESVYLWKKNMLICSVKNGQGPAETENPHWQLPYLWVENSKTTFILCKETHWLYWLLCFESKSISGSNAQLLMNIIGMKFFIYAWNLYLCMN